MNGPLSRGCLAGVLWMSGIIPDHARAQAAADQDFRARCDAPGVVKCLGFDNAAGISLVGAAKIDNAVKASGAGSMRVDIEPSAGDAPGNIVTRMGKDFGEGSSLYMQWRQRFSPEMITTNLGGEGFKQFVIYDGTPCGPNMEVAMLNQHFGGFPIFYSACGNSYFRKTLDGGGYALMWNQEGTICTDKDKSKCLKYQPDQWMTFYYEQRIGKWGQPNSAVKVSMAEANKPLQVFIDFPDFTFKSDKANSAYRDIWIGPYSMGRKPGQGYPAAKTWFDEFIISTQPIAAPSGTPTSLGNRVLETGGKAEASLHDVRGRMVRRVSDAGSNGIARSAPGIRNGVYLVKVRVGKREFTRKVPILD